MSVLFQYFLLYFRIWRCTGPRNIGKGYICLPEAPIHVRPPPRSLRSTQNLLFMRPFAHSSAYDNSFFPRSIALWNRLPPDAQKTDSLSFFVIVYLINLV